MEMRVNDITGKVIGCAIEVHRKLGPGLLESAYGVALETAMLESGMKCRSQVPVPVRFQNRVIGHCRPDFIVENAVVVEIKRVDWLDERAQAQILAYLRATGLRIGLLINFKVHPLVRGIRRFSL